MMAAYATAANRPTITATAASDRVILRILSSYLPFSRSG
jgi:hypothetical protein